MEARTKTCPDCGASFQRCARRQRCWSCAHRRDKFQLAIQAKVHAAIKQGKLTRGPCEICGKPKADAHHDDYGQPLNVRWLCRQHHQLHHAAEQRAGNLHPMTIARRLFLTEHREAKGISAEAMAGRLGIARESVYRIERDPWRLNGRKQLAYATALQIKPEDLWSSPC